MQCLHNVVERDRRVILEDIRRYVCHGILREEDGWVREEEEWTMRYKKEEEEANLREWRGGTAMGEPHAWHRQEELAPVRGGGTCDSDNGNGKGNGNGDSDGDGNGNGNGNGEGGEHRQFAQRSPTCSKKR
jgi:hypothetical protein